MKTTKNKILSIALILALALSVSAGCSKSGTTGEDELLIPPDSAVAAYTEAIPHIYDDALDFSEGLAAVQSGGKWGFIDKTGTVVIPLIYDAVLPFSEGLAAAKLEPDGLAGFIDKNGNEVIPFLYKGMDSFSEGLAVVEYPDIPGLDPAIAFIDKTGVAVTPLYYSAESFSEGLAVVQHGMMNYVYIDRTGTEVISIEGTNRGRSFSDGLALIYHYRNEGFIDKTGEIVIQLDDYSLIGDVESFSEGLALVRSVGLSCGFIDKTGALVISLDWIAQSFSEGLAAVSSANGWGYIDKTGGEVIAGKYDWAHDFHEGLAAVQSGGKLGFINAAGEQIVPFLYDYPNFDAISIDDLDNPDGLDADTLSNMNAVRDYLVSEGMAAVRLGGKWGFIAIPSAVVLESTAGPAEWDNPPVIAPAPTPDDRIFDVADISKGATGRIRFGDYLWQVLAVEDGKALLITETVIEKRAFNVEWKTITWEKCDIRKYLNGAFYDGFSAEEKMIIAQTRNENPKNRWFGTDAGKATTDMVFLLSLDEVVSYFGDSGQLHGNHSDHDRGLIDDQYNDARIATDSDGTAWYWWLRSFGGNSSRVAIVDNKGVISVDGGIFAADTGGVRPALWLNLG